VAITVTATASGTGSANGTMLAVRVLNGASSTQNGATANSSTITAPKLGITPKDTGSWVYGSFFTDVSGLTGLLASTASILNESDTTNAVSAGACRSASPTTAGTAATYGWSGPTGSSGNFFGALAEIIAAGTIAEDASTPAPVYTASGTAVTTASFTPPASSVLVAIVGANWTGSGGFTVAVSDSAGAYTWTQLVAIPTEAISAIWVGIPKVLSGAATLQGEGTLGGTWDLAAAAGLTGEGTLAADGVLYVPGTAGLGGEGTLGGAAVVTAPGTGTAALAGEGTLGGAAVEAAAAGLAGEGFLTADGIPYVPAAAGLAGEGFLTASGVLAAVSSLQGEGTIGPVIAVTWGMSGTWQGQGFIGASTTGLWQLAGALQGAGSLVISGELLGFAVPLIGLGFLSVPQVAGGLVNGVGGAGLPQAVAGTSQVAVAPPGSQEWQWLGTLGQVTALTYSYVMPGGCDKMSMTLMIPAAYRTQLFNPGWQVKITRGGHQVWYGKMDEPQPSPQGWTLTAVGAGNLGQNFVAYYSVDDVWPVSEPDEVLNRAISRGLPWVNPGLDASQYASQFWFGQAQDPGSITVNAFLNLICTRGGLTWYVSSQPGGSYGGNNLSVFPLPTTPSRLLVATSPVARTLGGDINTIFIRYMSVADNTATNTAASYDVVSAQDSASVTAHGVMETYVDLSNAGVMTPAQAQAVGNNVLALYQRASFAGPFTVSYGELLTMGGQPVDPGTDQAGMMVRLVMTDFGYGGEVVPGPVDVIVGAYTWDDFNLVATITPLQTLDQSLTGLLSMEATVLTPV
jgi:hypothetical protein